MIDKMPMTNVGKIYKPELRLMAAKAVVASLVNEACAALGVATTHVPPCTPMPNRA